MEKQVSYQSHELNQFPVNGLLSMVMLKAIALELQLAVRTTVFLCLSAMVISRVITVGWLVRS